MKVFVYFNLRKKLWSIRAEEGPNKGRVIGHAEYVTLADVSCKVSAKVRDRIRETKRKEVHAGLVGELCVADTAPAVPFPPSAVVPLYYNPYKVDTFVNAYNHDEEFLRSPSAWLLASTCEVRVQRDYSSWKVK